MSSTSPNSEFVLPNDQPCFALDASSAFELLSKNEKLYAHYLSKASYYGALIVLLQTSQESPQIFRLNHRILLECGGYESLKSTALASGCSDDDVKAFQVFCAGIYTNMGNYKGFGDIKIIPNLSAASFDALVKGSKAWAKDPVKMERIWHSCKDSIYSLSSREKQMGLSSKGITKYITSNCTQADVESVNRYMKARNMEGYISRLFKSADNRFEIRNAAIDNKTICEEEFEGNSFSVTCGDYNGLLELVVEYLGLAKSFACNQNEEKMLSRYICSFKEGSLEAHKDGSRHWIKNKSPAIETYIGFIETYRDPVGMRGEFEGFVAMVNKEQSHKFQELVDNAEQLLKLLPWSAQFEKDVFLKPDFTSLDVLAFAGSGIPIGINIPNYDEIRQSEGFKNVNLGNVISCRLLNKEPANFLSLEDDGIFKKHGGVALEIQVGLHELLGHGSGKLFNMNSKGESNFDRTLVNPETGKPVNSWYEEGETFDSKFTIVASTIEECRAEAVGLFLCNDPVVLRIFGVVDDGTNVVYANWLSLAYSGLKGLEMYNGEDEWKQAHCQGRFVLLQVMLEAGEDFVTVQETIGADGQADLLMTMKSSKIISVGRPAIGAFLRKLQVYKSTADLESMRLLYDKYSLVSTKWNTWRNIILARKKPRIMLVLPNTILKDEIMTLRAYDGSIDGLLQSWTDRFEAEDFYGKIDQTLQTLYEADHPHFCLNGV